MIICSWQWGRSSELMFENNASAQLSSHESVVALFVRCSNIYDVRAGTAQKSLIIAVWNNGYTSNSGYFSIEVCIEKKRPCYFCKVVFSIVFREGYTRKDFVSYSLELKSDLFRLLQIYSSCDFPPPSFHRNLRPWEKIEKFPPRFLLVAEFLFHFIFFVD